LKCFSFLWFKLYLMQCLDLQIKTKFHFFIWCLVIYVIINVIISWNMFWLFNYLEFVLYLWWTSNFIFFVHLDLDTFHYIGHDKLLGIYMSISKLWPSWKFFVLDMDIDQNIFIIKYNIHYSSIWRSLRWLI
jgi:hypothetical protein